jgi:hypothetical protein
MDDLHKVCFLFQSKNIDFIIVGARACALHGYIRATEDIDILIKNERTNIERVISCIQELYPHLEEITIDDFLSHIVVKILDEPELDIMLSAWSLTYQDAQRDVCKIIIDNLEIPFLGLGSLILSKKTFREQDQWDVKVLEELLKKQLKEKGQ